MEKEIITWIGLIGTIIGIVKGIIEIIKIRKPRISSKTIIILLLGVIVLLIGIIIKPECKNPDIKITFPSNHSFVNNTIDISGNVKCCPVDYRVALIIHRVPKDNILEKWFIHPDCASVNSNSNWSISNVNIGTSNTQDLNYEIFAYLVPDSVCISIQKIVNDPLYQGTFNKPYQINGVYNKIIVDVNHSN